MRVGHRIPLLLIGILLGCVVLAPVPAQPRWLLALHNAAHAPAFGSIAILLLVVLHAQARWTLQISRQYLISFAAAALFGLLSELVQIPLGRDASWTDVRHDVVGTLACLLALYPFDPRVPRRTRSPASRWASPLVALLLVGSLVPPLVQTSVEYRQRARQFPVLAEFSRSFDRYFIESNRTRLTLIAMPTGWSVRPGESTLRVQFLAEPYPGVDLFEPLPDWRGYAALALDVTNPTDATLELFLRVQDLGHNNEHEDRYNNSVRIAARTRQTLRFALADIRDAPARRELDLEHMSSVVLFRVQGSRAGEMYLSKVWLENTAAAPDRALPMAQSAPIGGP